MKRWSIAPNYYGVVAPLWFACKYNETSGLHTTYFGKDTRLDSKKELPKNERYELDVTIIYLIHICNIYIYKYIYIMYINNVYNN